MRNKLHVQGEFYLLISCYLLALPFPWVGAMLLAGFIHELGHCAALILLGEPILQIQIGASGAKIETMPMSPGKTILSALAGPAAGLILCLFHTVLPKTAVVALVQSIFNLLPFFPLDGGRVVRAAKRWAKR